MNRIYRRIWNATRRCWVVASELSSPRGKPARSSRSAACVAGLVLIPFAAISHAASEPDCTGSDVICVNRDEPTGIHDDPLSVAFFAPPFVAGILATGDTLYGNASTSGDHNSAFGASTEARGYGTAMGFGASAMSHGATAFGANAYARGRNSIALGRSASITYSDADEAIAIGYNAMAGTNATKGAVAIGAGSRAQDNSLALGYNAKSSSWDSVALGTSSVATEYRTVSVGSSDIKRRIVNVEKGRISSGSNDAVTGHQLFETGEKVTAAQRRADLAYTSAESSQRTADSALVKADSALSTTVTLRGLIDHASSSGEIRIGRSNSGSLIDIRNNGGNDRRIGGVADGQVSGTSREAVNGRQLNMTHELASQGKTAATEALKTAQAATSRLDGVSLALGQGASANVNSGTAVGGNAIAGQDSVALGSRSEAKQPESVAVGSRADAFARHSTALGSNSATIAAASTAVGHSARAGGTGAVSIGYRARADGINSLAIGASANAAHSGSVALGDGSVTDGVDQVSVGNSSAGTLRRIVNVARGALSATSTEAVTGAQLFAVDEMARGAETLAQGAATAADNAVAKVTVLEGLVREDGPSGSVRLGGNNSGSVLDVRNKSDGKRKITGVAEGALVAGSTEAVTGGQLAATNASVAGAETLIADIAARVDAASRHVAVGTPIDDEKAQAGRLGIAMGDSAVAAPTKDGAVALGSYSRALGENSVALGRASWVHDSATDGFALGVRAVVEERGGLALGAGSAVRKTALNAVAIGEGSVATESRTASFGDGALQRRLTNLARGTADHNATTVGQLNDTLATLGGGAKLDPAGNVTAPTYTVQNTRQHSVGDALTVLDGAVVRTTSRMDGVEGQLRSIFQDTPTARADGLNQITLAGANGMILSNVGNGLIAAGSRDAVNGGQLHSMQQQLNGRMDGLEQRIDGQPQSRMMALASNESGTPATPPVAEEPAPPASNDDKVAANTGNAPKSSPQPKAEAPESPKPQVDTAELEKMLARANDYSDGIAREVDARLNKMDKRFNRMAAMSSAQTAMAMNTAGLATYNRLGAGVGYAEGESAMAVGYQRVLNDKGSATFSLNGAFTNSGERSMGVGVGIGW